MQKQQKIKTALIATIFVLLFLLAYMYLAIVLTPKDSKALGGANFYRATAINTEAKNSLDVLFVGDSSAHHSFNPLQIYKDTGITTYNLGVSKQDPNTIKSQLKKVFKRQSPKLVVLETNCLFTNYETYGGVDWTQASLLIAPFLYHVRWKDLTIKDFFTLPTNKADDFKGYIYEDIVNDSYRIPEGFMANVEAEKQAINSKKEKAVKNILNYCKRKCVKVVLVDAPNPRDWDNAKSNAVKCFAEQEGIPFIDYNYYQTYNKLDFTKHFKDNGAHLNIDGANVISKYMSQYLDENREFYKLEDRRTNPKFESWNKLVQKYNYCLL